MADRNLQEIKDRLNIAEVLGGYIQIKKAGTSFKAVCPFHNEKTPSLQISPQKQIWHCFGCGEGGDIFTFVQKMENLEFKEVVKILADKAGVKLPEYKPKDKKFEEETEKLIRINNFAARYYHELLTKDKRGKPALAYLEKRGLKAETIKKWQIGYAPDEFHELEQALVKKHVGLQDLLKAGVSAKNERGQIYDRFRNRITFPVFNYNGEAVGFSARAMPGDDKAAKYINSPETLIYNKSRVLFGLNFAKNEIRKKDEAIFVEGQMDCISPHQAGFTNVVASSGTALTMEQLDTVGRLTKQLKFCFDADTAGLAATKRAVQMYLGKGFEIKVIVLEGVKDPDELIQKNPQAFAKAVEQAPLFLDFYINSIFKDFNPNSVEQKKRIAKDILPLVKLLTDPLEKAHYLQVLAERFGTNVGVLQQALGKTKQLSTQPSVSSPVSHPKPQEPQKAEISQISLLEKEVLGGMLMYPDLRKQFAEEGSPEDFEDPEVKQFISVLYNGENPAQEQLDSVLAKEAAFMVESQLEELEQNVDALKRQLYKSFALLRLNSLKKQQKTLNIKIKQAESVQDKVQLDSLNQEFAKLVQLRLKYDQVL